MAEKVVGEEGFEPPTSRSQSRRATDCATLRKMRDVQHLAGGESTRFAATGSIAEIAFRRHLNSETMARKIGEFSCRPRFWMENT